MKKNDGILHTAEKGREGGQLSMLLIVNKQSTIVPLAMTR